MIYLDSAATTLQKPEAVRRAAAGAIGRLSSPGRGGYPAAAGAEEVAFLCREAAGNLFHVPPERVVFTSNATHGLNIAIKSLVQPGDTVLISGYEHNAVTRPLYGMPHVTCRVAASPLFEPELLLRRMEDRLERGGISAVVCTHVSNVFGYILPVEQIAGLCRAHGVPLIVDASQSAGVLPIDCDGWGRHSLPCRATKGCMAPRGRDCCCAAKMRPSGRCWKGGRGACPGCPTCRKPCRTGWKRAPITCRASQAFWKGFGSFPARPQTRFFSMNGRWQSRRREGFPG